jgi:ABC-2 type transport system ATP-binding protein
VASLQIENLCIMRGQQLVIDKLSLQCSRSTWLGLLGANGSGKTTLLRALAGRLPLLSGKISLSDCDVSKNRQERAKRIGFAVERSHLPTELTPSEVFDLSSMGRNTVHDKELSGIFESLKIDQLIDKKCGTLSNGNAQRIAIFSAFLNRASVIILDEPFNWLDPVTAYDFKIALADYVKNNDVILITALHDLSTLLTYCDRGLIITSGKISADLSSDDLRSGLKNIQKFEYDITQILRQ